MSNQSLLDYRNIINDRLEAIEDGSYYYRGSFIGGEVSGVNCDRTYGSSKLTRYALDRMECIEILEYIDSKTS